MRLSRAAALRSLAVAFFALATLPAAAPPANVLDLVSGRSDLSTLAGAVKTAGLESELSGAGPITLFAPTNAAFAAMPAAEREALLKPEGKDRLRALLLGHVVREQVQVRDDDTWISSGTLPTAAGTTIAIATDGKGPMIGKAHPLKTDMRAGNGLVTTIDRVLQ
ncbi:MAG: hypothetical protein QOI11_3428 [Candidatus Eremiobacteraeota bacterium]|jgi:uncharacterized surface protein with fasciclin (FAS1) repeats|nr:hypothetical protein [Candidatus Eremiobacteraeota bacterium]